MRLLSPNFNHGDAIPRIHTCDGQELSPRLKIEDVPAEAKSLVLLMEDPDVPMSVRIDGLFVHWVVYNIPPETSEVLEGQEPSGVSGLNTTGETGYIGPCPPDKEHRYFFKLFALDTMLTEAKPLDRLGLLSATEGHVLDAAELMGIYDRTKI